MLLDAGAELLLHLGDVGSEAVIDELSRCPARLVFGNCDLDVERLRRHAEAAGVACDHPLGTLSAGGRRIAYTHGHLAEAVRAALDGDADYVLHGHTHVIRDERLGPTRLLNPGALHRAARYTCLLLDPSCDAARWLEVARDSNG
jgi:putative phosphoesterase